MNVFKRLLRGTSTLALAGCYESENQLFPFRSGERLPVSFTGVHCEAAGYTANYVVLRDDIDGGVRYRFDGVSSSSPNQHTVYYVSFHKLSQDVWLFVAGLSPEGNGAVPYDYDFITRTSDGKFLIKEAESSEKDVARESGIELAGYEMKGPSRIRSVS